MEKDGTSQVTGQLAGGDVSVEQSATEVTSIRTDGGMRKEESWRLKWGNVRSKLQNMGCVCHPVRVTA